MEAAVFSDVEGTLIDANLPRLSFQVGAAMGLFSRPLLAQLALISLISKALPPGPRRRARLSTMRLAMRGQTEEQVAALSEAVATAALALAKPASLARLRQHQSEGLQVVLVSAGLDLVVAGLARKIGARGEGTKVARRNGRFLARFDGPPCEGQAKAERARRVLGEINCEPAISFAYGDTASDIPFLELFGHPAVVDPDAQLRAHAVQAGWQILTGY